MATMKIAITVEQELLETLDRLVAKGRYPNRSQAIQAALREHMDRWKRTRLTEELDKIDPSEEQRLADEFLMGDEWPPY